jgi:hypothetical protein
MYICIYVLCPSIKQLTTFFHYSFHMARTSLASLESMWLGGREGTLSPLSQAKAWALREVWSEQGKASHGMFSAIAKRLTTVGTSRAPGDECVRKLFLKMDSDDAWFPGKTYRARCGPQPALTGTNKSLIARSAMRMKGRGNEPTYARLIAACPLAIVNPDTGKPVDKKRVYSVLRERCFDKDPEEPWACRPRLSKTALSDVVKDKRLAWAKHMQGLGHASDWYFRNVVWTDLCNSILPRTESKADDQARARKGHRGWMSRGSQQYSPNLRGSIASVKQNSWDTVRVWWAPVLSRGKLHVELLPEDFPGETPDGAAELVVKVRKALNMRFQQGPQPRVLFTDRGKGFFAANNGKITEPFAEALRKAKLRAFMGVCAAQQPGSLQEVMLHETAVAWIRARLTLSTPTASWLETRDEHAVRLRQAVDYCNAHHDVDGLCRALPKRLEDLVNAKGDKLRQ